MVGCGNRDRECSCFGFSSCLTAFFLSTVPTNYQVKTKAGATLKDDEEKNLGRWVNRQRSLYQAGKLRKDRQVSLEQVGLKWSMLATTSWESMYDTLCEYVASKVRICLAH